VCDLDNDLEHQCVAILGECDINLNEGDVWCGRVMHHRAELRLAANKLLYATNFTSNK
jgi:hypothetical protein